MIEGKHMSNKIAHLEMIEKIIDRMANNSLQLKCWSIALTVAIIAFTNGILVLTGLLPLVILSLMDAKYLALERSYRTLYDEVRIKDDSEIDYSMKIIPKPIKETLFSWSVLSFYVLQMILIISVSMYYILNLQNAL